MGDVLTYFDELVDVEAFSIPEKFTYPFYYKPHPLAEIAAKELKLKISNLELEHNFGFEDYDQGKVIGKMFGVLVVQDSKSRLGYLAAFSGKLANSNHHDGFVPPVFDMLTAEGFYRSEEEGLNKYNREIESLENDPEYLALIKAQSTKEKEIEQFRSHFKTEYKSDKAKRLKIRTESKAELESNEYQKLLSELDQESITQTRSHKRELKNRKAELDEINSLIKTKKDHIAQLRKYRKAKSKELQKTLFDQYSFLNIKGEQKSLWSIFYEEMGTVPPSGAGECALPKMLHYAFMHDLKPICMAEFWWGTPPKGKIRQHLNYYPACKSKCRPILKHMLDGMAVEQNRLESTALESKELEIIYEDEYLVAVNKPEGMLSVPGKEINNSVYTWAESKYPNATGPLIVHRLDMSTSGILLICKDKDTHKALQKQFQERTIHKRYAALLDGELTIDQGKIELPLALDIDNRPQQMISYDRGKEAVTHFKRIKIESGKTKVHFFPVTGRTHQLRVHAASKDGLGLPIIGDDIYGKGADRLYLHAEGLEFTHPITLKRVKLNKRALF